MKCHKLIGYEAAWASFNAPTSYDATMVARDTRCSLRVASLLRAPNLKILTAARCQQQQALLAAIKPTSDILSASA